MTAPAAIDERSLAALLDEPLGCEHKALPPFAEPLTLRTLGRQALSVLDGDLMLPVMVLKEAALAHNLATMAAFCRDHGVALAPHGKTTMAPQLLQRQLEAGAWGITAAMPSQVRLFRAFGVRRILLANELVQPSALAWVARELDADPAFDFLCLVDSPEGVALMTRALAAAGARRALRVLVELGPPDHRSGARTVEEAMAVVAAVERSPALELAGVEGYEGVIGADRSPATVAAIDRFLGDLRTLVDRLDGAGAFAGLEEIVVTAGGSAFFDEVVEHVAALDRLSRPARLVLRSGCYLTHDHGVYEDVSPLAGRLRPALELWAQVLSRPEPGLAVAGFGKRDAPFDVAPPTPLLSRDRSGALHSLAAGTVRVRKLHDQHAELTLDGEAELEVGDLVGCGISHPCTAFDKWRLLPTVDDDYRVVGGVRTFF